MPEGDTIYRAALNVHRALAGHAIRTVQGSHPAVRSAAPQLTGAVVLAARSYGKQHLIDTDAGLTIRTHMGMPGVWHVYERPARWSKPAGAARVVLATERHEAVCFAAPTVEVERTARIDAALAEWGPDLTADEFDRDEAMQRLAGQPGDRTIGDVMLDQRVMAGIGNVFKSEISFMQRIHPDTPLAALDAEQRDALVARSRQLLFLNRARAQRITTGDMRRGRGLWVYGRDGEPCRRCRTPVAAAWIGDFERITYWCPRCQPDPRVPSG